MNTPSRRRPVAAFFTQVGRRGRAGAADYFYQVLIVIIGVYLGITFESKASDHDRAKKARAALVQLVGDMKRDDIDMSRVIEAQQSQARDYSEIAQWLSSQPTAPSVRIDSLLEKVTTSPTVYPRRGLYSSMIAAGQFSLLPVDLSGSIVNLYENIYTRLAANGEHYDYSLERDYFPAYTDTWDPTRMSLITSEPTERVRFRNIVLIMQSWSSYYANLVAESQTALRAVMKDIEAANLSPR